MISGLSQGAKSVAKDALKLYWELLITMIGLSRMILALPDDEFNRLLYRPVMK